MCGVFGYIGADNHSIKRTIAGLKDLEYRGYDSWGVVVDTPTKFFIRKSVGKISVVRERDFRNVLGTLSLGHSRWATHGGVTKKNAHPHTNACKTIAVVHNGIIENYALLRKKLSGKKFVSETDTEVVPHLIEYYMDQGHSFADAFVRTTRELRGRFAIVAVHHGESRIMVARNGSPPIIGRGVGETLIASDIPAFLSYTKTVNYLDDGEYATIDRNDVTVHSLASGKIHPKKDVVIEWGKESASKDNFAHFMIKEIFEQKDALRRVLSQEKKDLARAVDMIYRAKHIYIVGCGTAAHMGRAGGGVFFGRAVFGCENFGYRHISKWRNRRCPRGGWLG